MTSGSCMDHFLTLLKRVRMNTFISTAVLHFSSRGYLSAFGHIFDYGDWMERGRANGTWWAEAGGADALQCTARHSQNLTGPK